MNYRVSGFEDIRVWFQHITCKVSQKPFQFGQDVVVAAKQVEKMGCFEIASNWLINQPVKCITFFGLEIVGIGGDYAKAR
jgi:hypothetical protein